MEEKFDLVSFRAARRLTQRDLAKALDVNWKYISMIETGVKPLSNKLKARLDQLQLDEGALQKDQPDLDKAPCPRCSQKDLEISALREELKDARAVIRDQASALAAALAAKPSPAAAPVCSASNGGHKERRGA
jgi:transcriptional regulator with XRE-family HTH domain